MTKTSAGIGVDSEGRPVIDPTENVKDVLENAVKRQDDLRESFEKLFRAEILNLKELILSNERHQRELDKAESDRLNSVRLVDREEVTKTAAQALTAIQTLQATTNTTAETLRNQVAMTAQAAATQLQAMTAEINKRLSALELSSSEGKGKQGVSDPMMEKLMGRMDSLLESRSAATGKTAGINWVGVVTAGVIAVIGSLIGIAGWLYAALGK